MSDSCNNCKRHNRWYFGGVAAAMAVSVTHPLDLLKVHLQTQQKEKLSMFQIIPKIIREHGFLAFYNGLSASLVRQLTYSTARIGIYEVGKRSINTDSFMNKFLLATVAGAIGGTFGVPFDVVNVRMQNDVKLPPDKRRNYSNVFDGLRRIYLEEGIRRLFVGGSMAVTRGCLMTIGQNAVYDQAKAVILTLPNFSEGIQTHMSASIVAAIIATILTQPLDVLKTRTMNAKPGEYKNAMDVLLKTAKEGPLAFYKGFIPATLRLGPTTILLFVFMEQLRLRFGYIEKDSPT